MQAPTLSCCKKSSKSEAISLEVVRGGSRWWRNLLERAIHGTYTRLNEPPRLVNIGTTGGHSSHSLSSLVVFHSYRWSLAPPGYYQPSSHYSLHWSRNTWLRQHMDQHWVLQDWMQRALYFQWFDLCCTSPWRSTGSPTSQNIWNYQRWQASCVSLSLLPIRSQITCTRDYKRVQTKMLFTGQMPIIACYMYLSLFSPVYCTRV